ncbi:MAG: PAS domain S-box protein [Gammaproteobacteria bacterium]|nr:PAS domain S-box protein [Gammaproteobacteria bacterium]MBU1481906.1 PAS domain S-box protein [Gammaproteobacteria bacterium]
MTSSHFSLRNTIWLLTGLALLFVIVWRAPAFYAVQGLASYLPLHMFAETFSIVVSMMVFGIAWNIHSKERQDNYVILACALLAVGLIDFAHMLSFKGMPDFITPSGPEKAINFWLSARLIAALALLAVSIRPWQPSHNPRIRYSLLAISLVVAAGVIWLGLAYPQAWPHTFIEGTGLTPFKIGAEYAIIAILLVPAIRFYRQSGQRQSYDAVSLFAATVVTILSELSFTVYSDVADIFNLLGHLYKIVAYAFIYRAVFVGSVNEPFHRLDAELAENTRITKQLQDSAAERTQLAAIVEFSNDAIIGKTPEGIITSWNKGAEKIYGYSAAEIIGKHITILALPEQHAEMHLFLAKIRDGGIVVNHETERIRKDGTRFQVSLTLSPIRDASGKISGISTIARDISEQKRMEQERAETLRYFESMDRVNRAMQGAKDLESMLSNVLGEVLEIFDCDRVGLVHPCDPHSPTWQIVMERAKPGFSTEPMRGPLPMTSIRADSMQLLLDAHGPVQFIPEDDPEKERLNTFGIRSFMSIAVHPRIGSPWEFGIHQCVTPRTWNAQAVRLFEEIARRLADGLNTMLVNRNLRESEQRYRLVFENSPVSIWEEDFSGVKALLDDLRRQGVTDLDAWFTQHPETLTRCAQATKILDVNSAAIGLHGATSKEGLLSGLLDTFTPESFETFRRELLCLWNGGTQMAEDAVVKTLGGELRHVTIYFAVCPGYETTWGKVIVSLVDITDRKRAEEQIRQSETKYRTLIQNIQAAIVVHAPDTRILIANSQAQEILGLSAEQLQGKTAIDPDWHFLREDGNPATPEEYPVNRVLASGQAIRNMVMGVHRPGHATDVWVLVNADPVLGEEGAIEQIIVTFIDISERKQMEAALRESEERFHGMFEKHHAVMLLIEPETGRIIDANPAAANYYGYPLGKLKSMVIQDINMLSPEQIAQERQRAVQEERSYFVFPHRLASGEIRMVEVHSSPVTVRGKPLLFSITHDITERKQAETNLKRMNERLALATRAASMGVWDWDIPKNELVWDDRMYALYGIKREDFAGAYDAWLKGVHPDDRIRGDEAIQMALRGEGEFDTEFRVLWPDGSVHTLKAFGQIVRDADGTPLRMTGINFDITERKQAEEALRASRDEYRRTLDNMMEGCQIVGFDWRFLYVNDAVAKHGRRAKEELLGHTMLELYPGMEKSDMFAELRRCMDSRIPVHTENEFSYPDGSKSFFELSIQPVPEGIFILSIDITERKQAEEALRREQALLNRIMVTSPVGIAVVNKEGQITFANPQAEKILGLSKEKITQLSYNAPEWHSTAIDGSPFPDEAQPFSLVMATRQPVFDVQHAIAWPDGRRVLLSINGAPLFDAQGEIEGVAFAIEDITERKLADETLRRSEHGLSEAQRIAHLGNWELDLVKNVLTWSDEIYRIFEIDPEKFGASYEAFLNAIHPEDRDMVNQAYNDSVKNKVPYDIVHRLLMPDGRIKYVNEKCETYYGADGKPLNSFGTVHDITERILDQQALLRLNRELRAISNCNLVLMRAEDEQTLLDNICRIVCDEAGYRMAWVGYPENDEAKTIRPVAWAGVEDGYLAQAGITWADTERGREPSGTSIRSGKSACFQDISTDLLAAPWRESAMQRGYRSSITLPLKDENANTFGILTIYSTEPNAFTPEEIRLLEELAGDLAFGIITLRTRAERKQAEQALRVERGLFVAGPSVVFKWRPQEGWPVEYVSPNVMNQFGYAPEDLTSGKVQYASIVHPDDIARVGNEVSTYSKEGAASFEQMYRIAGADGRYRWIEDFTTVIRGLDGAITHYLGYLQDITERKQAEEEIMKLNRELEQRVAARTADLEAANQELESFSYSVSHDLRTPLRAIDGFSHILLDDYADKLDEEGKRLLNVVRNNTGRMGQLIDDILKFSRAGRLEINYSEIDMEQLAFSVFVELRPVVAGDKLQMEIEHIPPARGDSAMMRQVFVNLLSNAIKFSATKEAPQIQVGATVKDDETIYYVKDNGAGFDMQYANKLFGVFQRLHGVTEFEGTGIGLAIVKRIIARHGGRVWAEGKVGEGAVFYFALPKRETNHE